MEPRTRGTPVPDDAAKPDVEGLRAEVCAWVERAPTLDLPRLAGVFAEAQALVTARLAAPPSPQPVVLESDLLKPHEAAELARVEVTQIYRWARSRGGRSWTMRPSRKCLRIVRPRFVAWLAAGGAARRP